MSDWPVTQRSPTHDRDDTSLARNAQLEADLAKWTPDPHGDLTGKTYLITGGNSGIGYEAAKVLAQKGGTVIIACRNTNRAQVAIETIRATSPNAQISSVLLDLADLNSVRHCAEELNGRLDYLDVLINNAGVMALPYSLTNDGFEMQLGTNHLGHFALTAWLLPSLSRTADPRVINVASNAHKGGRVRFDDINAEKHYSEWGAYAQSKLSNLLFFAELHRRRSLFLPKLRSLACHPGYSDTKLLYSSPSLNKSRIANLILKLGGRYVAQSAKAGAWPTLYAALEPIPSGSYIGPDGLFGLAGQPTFVTPSKRAKDEKSAQRLWELSEAMTGVCFPTRPPTNA